MPPEANETLIIVGYHAHLFSAAPYKLGQGKLGSMCRGLNSTNSMGIDQDSNPRPFTCKA